MDLRAFLENQIKKGNINWKSKSELVRESGNKISGNNSKIIKEFENKFQFGSEIEIKNNVFLTSSKCLFLFSLEKLAGKSVSKKYEQIVLKKFEEITDNFKTFIYKDILDQIK